MSLFSQLSNWWNGNTGQGSFGDHGGAPQVAVRPPKAVEEIAELLAHAPLLRNVCEAYAEDITRAWRTHTNDAVAWTAIEEEFEFRDVAEQLMFFAEGFGGAYLLPRFASSVATVSALRRQRKPLERGFLGFKVLAQHEVRRAPNTQDRTQPNGLPEYYVLNEIPNVVIHHSWFLPLRGPTKVPSAIRYTSGHTDSPQLGQSRVDIVYDDFARMASSHASLAHILIKGNIDVLGIVGLAEAMSRCDTTEQMSAELQKLVLQATATITGANTFQPMVIDAEEKLERKSGNHTGAADLAQQLMSVYVAATKIPRTRLLGEQAKGLGNGGEADLLSYYDRVATYRERRITRVLNWMDTVVAPTRVTAWEYNPLWELSSTDIATIEKTRAETDKVYIEAGIPGIVDAVKQRLTLHGQYTFTGTE